ncbi:MAG: aminotransferase [Bacteroidetes bacterium]|nr:MAG: aminotransferase [Bacteroidota bacterium]PTM13792.1 MAG: aminotransferase [Bacteroidota bacterium]
MSPQLKSVAAAGIHALERKNKPNRLAPEHFFSQVKGVKAEFARLINTPEPGRIALIPAASYGIATVAKNLPLRSGQDIIVAKDQFPSNYYSWARLAQEKGANLRMVEVPAGPDKGRRWNEAILAAIGPQTALVAISHVHWAEGVLFDLLAFREKTDQFGAWLVVDGTQSVGALPFDVAKIRPDALVCAAYKWLMGPYATALAYYGPVLDNGVPIEENWINRKNSENFQGLVNYQSDYQPLAGRYCVGEHSNFVLMPMLETALQQLNAWEPQRIQDYLRQLNAPYIQELLELGFRVLPEAQRAHHLVGLGLPAGVEMEPVQAALAAANVIVSVRGQSIRIAPNVYNDARDWEQLMGVLRQVKHTQSVH